MSPFEQAALWHNSHSDASEFPKLIEAHARHGIVICSPEVFLLARPVLSSWPPDHFDDYYLTSLDPDCLHIWLLVGKVKSALEWFHSKPAPPFLSYHRADQVLRIIPTSRFIIHPS